MGDPTQIPGFHGVAIDPMVRLSGLGLLSCLNDTLFYMMVRMLDDHSVLNMTRCSRALYWYCEDEDQVWKRRALNRFKGRFRFKGTWKRTALLPYDVPESD